MADDNYCGPYYSNCGYVDSGNIYVGCPMPNTSSTSSVASKSTVEDTSSEVEIEVSVGAILRLRHSLLNLDQEE